MTQPDNTRPCEVKRSYASPIKGTFHRWGSRVAHTEANDIFQVTVGIVEGEDGNVMEVEPHLIKFT